MKILLPKINGRILTLFLLLLLLRPGLVHAQYDKDVFLERGRLALGDGRTADALSQFNILVQLDTTDHRSFFLRGIAKYNLGDIRGARADFNTAVRLNPVFTAAYHYRAITASRSGDYASALEDLKKAIELRPGASGVYFTRGVTYFLSQQFAPAVADFDRYIRREPKDPSAYLNRGAAYLFLGDTTRALSDYNKAIRLDRFEPDGYLRRGRLRAEQGQPDEALADFNKAIELDTTRTLAWFNRALLHSDQGRLKAAIDDLDQVLRYEPGNALTLYNRSLLCAQVGDFEGALADMDRVIYINPGNVLAWFNRAGFFAEMQRWDDALADYNKAIELYPDFAKAYLNRSYVELQLGMTRASKEDLRTARKKVADFRAKSALGTVDFADTTRKYSALLAFDADFAKKDFDDEMLQHRDVDINLKPLFRIVPAASRENTALALEHRYEHPLLDRFLSDQALPLRISNEADGAALPSLSETASAIDGAAPGEKAFLQALCDIGQRQYNSALVRYGDAIRDEQGRYAAYYQAYYYMNRGVLRAEMVDFIAAIESNVQTLTMDDSRTARARVREQVSHRYDYSEALADMEQAARTQGDIPYIQFNLGNLYCLSQQLVKALEHYDRAIELYPYLKEGYFNRGLLLIYLKDKEKGCIDLSRAGELGLTDAYQVIARYCEEDNR